MKCLATSRSVFQVVVDEDEDWAADDVSSPCHLVHGRAMPQINHKSHKLGLATCRQVNRLFSPYRYHTEYL